MKLIRSFFLLLSLLAFSHGHSQALKKYPIRESACSLYSYCWMLFERAYSSDSSKVFTGECNNDEVIYGVICVQLLHTLSDPERAEGLMISYTDFLKKTFKISKAAGYGKGHRLNNNETTRGILDYWEDEKGNKWKIKSWTDGRYIGFMYAYSKKELPEQKVNVFLDGFRLPGM